MKKPVRETHSQRLCRETAEHGKLVAQVLAASSIRNIDPNRGDSGIAFLGFASWGWGPCDPELERARMNVPA